jgi:hypothetical protein
MPEGYQSILKNAFMTTRIPKCFKMLSWLQGYQSVFKHLHDYEDAKVFWNTYMTTKMPKCFEMLSWLQGYQSVFKRLHDYEDAKVF